MVFGNLALAGNERGADGSNGCHLRGCGCHFGGADGVGDILTVEGDLVVALADGRADIPILRGRGPLGGKAAAYLRRDKVWLEPVTDPAELEALLRRP